MSDMTNLTAGMTVRQLSRKICNTNLDAEEQAEICRRLERLEKCKALCEYANHTYPCPVLDGGNKCTCGYDAARAAVEGK